MKRKRHNKKRNTAFLYETLINEMTKAVVSGKRQKVSKITNIMKKYFNDGSVLKEEVDLYNTLMSTKNLDKDTALRMLEETKKVYFALNQQNIFDQQTEAIDDINKTLTKDVFSNFIPNYKNLATISQIFSKKTPVKQRVLLEKKIKEAERVFNETQKTLKAQNLAAVLEFRKTEQEKEVDAVTKKYDDIIAKTIEGSDHEEYLIDQIYV